MDHGQIVDTLRRATPGFGREHSDARSSLKLIEVFDLLAEFLPVHLQLPDHGESVEEAFEVVEACASSEDESQRVAAIRFVHALYSNQPEIGLYVWKLGPASLSILEGASVAEQPSD